MLGQSQTPPSGGTVPPAAQIPAVDIPNYAGPGPFTPTRLPTLEHIFADCYPRCTVDQSILRVRVVYPKGGTSVGLLAPYPLVIISPGFLLGCEQYMSYAERLASWGYTVLLYDRSDRALDPMPDVVAVQFVKELIDWCASDRLLKQLADTDRVLLCGHSRGAKLSTLAAIQDPRVKALFLIDPVDTTVYAPLSPDYPSAVAGLSDLALRQRALPLAVVGGGRGGDCVPPDSNHRVYYEAAAAPAWEVVLEDAGHFQFLDGRGGLLDAICAFGGVADSAVQGITQAMMVAWAETMVREATPLQAAAAHAGKPPLKMGVDASGRLVAGVASFDAAQRLFATEARALELLQLSQHNEAGAGGGGGGTPPQVLPPPSLRISTRLKNFSL